jgi:HAMP domain-containing protein
MNFTKKIIFSSILFLIIFLLFIFFLILPQIRKINELSREISQKVFELEGIEKRQKEIEEFKRFFPEIKENFSKLELSFIDNEFPVSFIEFLEKMGKDLVSSTQVSILSSTKNSMKFQVQGKGNLENVFKLIEKVENCQYLIQIERIEISKTEESKLKETKGSTLPTLEFKVLFTVQTK